MLRTTAISAVGALFLAALPNLKVGDAAPDFRATDSQGTALSLAELRSNHRGVVLVFFPKARTPGCTRELTHYVEQAQALQAQGACVLAISGDKAEGQEVFRKQLKANFRFVPDPDGRLMKMFGTKYPLLNVSRRKTFIVDQLGRIAHIEEGSDAESLKGVARALGALAQP